MLKELKQLAEDCSTGVVLSEKPYKDYKKATNPQTILRMIAIMEEMAEALKLAYYDEDGWVKNAEEALTHYKEIAE